MEEKTDDRGEEPGTVVEAVDPLGRTLHGTTPARRFRKGDTLGRYLILGVLGEGGMAVVYKGYDPELDRRVAIKLLTVDESTERAEVDASEGRRRLLREAQAMAQLAHPNVVAIYDVGMHGDQVFIAMELVERGTVGQWLREQPRGWRDVLDVFRQAGRGLEAAHALRLVHRDVKPSNMLLGRDGRVRVTDFGIVKQVDVDDPNAVLGAKPPLERPSDPVLASTMTHAGSMMGTLGYMAPEQLEGGPVDARADQFGFCVSLYRALYDALPFEPGPRGAQAVEPKDTRGVPAWVTLAVMRGLRTAPEARFASMSELLAALERDPARSRRQWWIGAGAVTLVTVLAGAAGASVVRSRNQTAALCQGAPERLAGIWDGDRKRAVHSAFIAVDKPYAEDAYQRVERALDAYAESWVTMQTESCRATKLRGEQSAELLDLRTACLDRRLDELRAETELFAKADARVVENAVQATGALTSLDECARRRVVARTVASADRPGRAGQNHGGAQAARGGEGAPRGGQVQRGDRHRRSGGHRVALDRLSTARSREPRSARLAGGEGGRCEEGGGDAGRPARRGRGRPARLHGRIGAHGARLRGRAHRGAPQGEPRPIPTGLRDASSAWEETTSSSRRWSGASAAPHYALGQYTDMLASDGRRRSPSGNACVGPEDRHLAIVLSDMGNALGMLGRHEEALATYRRALAIDEAALGSSHPDVGQILQNMGWVLSTMKRHDEALSANRRAATIFERTIGTDHTNYAYAVNSIGWALLAQGKDEEARESFERALKIWEEVLGHDNPMTADPLTGIGLAELGQHKAAEALDTDRTSLVRTRSQREGRHRFGGDPVRDGPRARRAASRSFSREGPGARGP